MGYREFLIAGVFAQTVIFGATFTGAGLAEDMTKGIVDRFRSLPISRAAVLVGRTGSDVAYNSIPNELCSEFHERVADWLDLQGAGQYELAGYHLEHAYRCRLGAGPPDRRARRLAGMAASSGRQMQLGFHVMAGLPLPFDPDVLD